MSQEEARIRVIADGTGKAAAEVAKVDKSVESLGNTARKAGSGVSNFGGATGSATQQTVRMRGRTSDATTALIDLGRVAEDSAYGIRGVANNINPLIGSFGRLRDQTGSAKGALQALLSGMAGPAGLMVVVGLASTLLITFGDKIAGAFNKGSSAAEKFREKVEAALNAIASFEGDLPGALVTPDTVDDVLRNTREAGLRLLEQREDIEKEISRLVGARIAAQTEPEKEAVSDLIDAAKERLRVTKIQIGNEARLFQFYKDQKEQYILQEQAQEVIVKRGGELVKDAKATADAAERTARALAATSGEAIGTGNELDQLRQRLAMLLAAQRAEEAMARQLQQRPTQSKGREPDAFEDLILRRASIRKQFEAGLIDPMQRAAAEASALKRAIQQMIDEGADPTALAPFVDEVNRLEEAAKDTGTSFDEMARIAQESIPIIAALFEGQHTARMNQIEQEREAQISAIDAELASEKISERERTRLIQQRAQLEDRFRDQQKEAAKEQARNQKTLTLFEIAVNTASAVVEALPNIPLSITVGALGALQAAVVAAQPIPEFARGVTNFSGGMAVVGEQGPEIVRLPRGSDVVPNRPSMQIMSDDRLAVQIEGLRDDVRALELKPALYMDQLHAELDKQRQYERRIGRG